MAEVTSNRMQTTGVVAGGGAAAGFVAMCGTVAMTADDWRVQIGALVAGSVAVAACAFAWAMIKTYKHPSQGD